MARRGRARPRALRGLAALAAATRLPAGAAAQEAPASGGANASTNSSSGGNGSNGSNATNATEGDACMTPTCCGREVRSEALLACREFESLGVVSDQNCKFWADYAESACRDTCGDCAEIARQVYNACLFLLQTKISWNAARPYCIRLERDFRNYRCPSACIDKAKECFTDKARECNALCGNYNYAPGIFRDGCNCVKERAVSGNPDYCWGQTILSGQVTGGPIGLMHSCLLVPEDCKNHKPYTSCGYYKHCPVDVCVVKKVTCPKLDSCQTDGICASANGQCYYQPLADGLPCDDGLFYTHTDTCFQGTCIGIVNKCLRDAVNCSTPNPCLHVTDKVPRGCDPPTGNCVFEHAPENAPCASLAAPGAGAVPDGNCMGGLCRRDARALDPCANTTCPSPGPCHAAPACSREVGCLPAQPKPEGSSCDDGKPDTHGDRCIEGRCLGDPIPEPDFHNLGSGSCSGRGTVRYSADVPDIQDCRDQCREDPECSAFSHGYHTCSIFGTTRERDPNHEFWGRQWLLEFAPVRVRHAVFCFEKSGQPYWDSLTAVRKALLMLTVAVLLLLPLTWLAAVGHGPLCRSCRRLLGQDACRCCEGCTRCSRRLGRGAGKAGAAADGSQSPRSSGTQVAAASMVTVPAPAVQMQRARPPALEELSADETAGSDVFARVLDPRGEVQSSVDAPARVDG